SRAIKGRLDPVELADRALITDVPRVECGLRLEQQHVRLLGRHGEVFDAPRDDDELALAHRHVAVPELEQEPAFHDEKQLVLQLVMMPHELAFDLDEFHVGVVDFAHDLRAPMLVELPELRREIHAVHGTFPKWRSAGRAVWRTGKASLAFQSAGPSVPPTARSCARTGSTRRRRGSAPSREMCARSPARAGSASRATRRSRDSHMRTCPRWWV